MNSFIFKTVFTALILPIFRLEVIFLTVLINDGWCKVRAKEV